MKDNIAYDRNQCKSRIAPAIAIEACNEILYHNVLLKGIMKKKSIADKPFPSRLKLIAKGVRHDPVGVASDRLPDGCKAATFGVAKDFGHWVEVFRIG